MNIPKSIPVSNPARLALVVGMVGFCFFLLQLSPGSNWRDGAEFIGVANSFGIAHPTGYPAFSILSRLSILLFAWITTPAVGANLFSALAGGATLAILALAAWKVSGLLRLGPIPTLIRIAASDFLRMQLGGYVKPLQDQ